MRKVDILNGLQGMKLHHMKHLPLYQFELLPTGACETTLVEGSRAGVHKIAREVRISRSGNVAVVADQEIISSSESRPITIETANRLIF